MKVLILCGGRGIRLSSHAEYIPKAMVHVGTRPILWHIMKRYALFGHTEFILALGNKEEMIRDYFIHYNEYASDIRLNLDTPANIAYLTGHQEKEWDITCVDTGDQASSGARIARCRQYLGDVPFMVSYSDNVSDIDLHKLEEFYRSMKCTAVVTGVIPPYRELEFHVKDGKAVGYFEPQKAAFQDRYINGGYMVFSHDIFSYLSVLAESRLESDAFAQLITDKQLAIYPHHGFWRWLDTDRDSQYLNSRMEKNDACWLQ